MDAEDRMFIRVVGERAAKTLRSKNIRLWKLFKDRCDENGEKPEAVLGRVLYKFAKSIIEEDGEFADELLGKVINISAFRKREDIMSKIDELIDVKKKLEQTGSSRLDELIERLIENEIVKASVSPVEAVVGGVGQQQQGRVVIDENMLAQLDVNSLSALENMVRKVKAEKRKAESLTVEELLGGADEGLAEEPGQEQEQEQEEEENEEE